MNTALEVFNIQEKGILNIIRAADIYAIHILAKLRAVDPDRELITKILEGNKISGYNIMSIHYRADDLIQLQESGYLREVGEQIIVATYTALESYLIEKFKEYYSYLMSGVSSKILNESLKRIRFRDLSDIKRNFYDFLDIHLPSFDMEYFSDEKCSFRPKDSWDAIKMISKARNEIVHQGTSRSYIVSTLMDSWYPFDFSRRWVTLFDANFDRFIYDKYETRLIKEYKIRKEELKNI
jgi:hypothetical protein